MAPPRPHLLAVSRPARLARRAFETMWANGVTQRPPLEPDFLWHIGSAGFDTADEVSIRPPEDVADFRERLERLCRALREEAELNPLGHTLAYGQLTGAIRQRHALGRYWRRHPGAAETVIAPPIVVVGQMRSGTTRLQRLLAADPRHAGTRFCNSHQPVPPGSALIPDLRPARSRVALAIARRINPWLDTLHPFGATRTDEEIGWLGGALDACAYEAQWRIPSYVAFNEAREPGPVYREFVRILRTDAAHMRDAARPRVLKCPQFTEDIATIAECLPDARLVVATRDRAGLLASTVSMVAAQAAFQSDSRTVEEITAEWRRKIDLREQRMAEGLARFAGPTATVPFAALNRDWRAAMAGLYCALDLEWTAQAQASMAAEQRRSARDPHHGHRDQLSAFGAPGQAGSAFDRHRGVGRAVR